MPETEAITEGSRATVENLSKWLEERDAKDRAETPEPEAQPETPAVPAQVAQPVTDWREVVLPEDVDHGFFRGKKVPDVLKAYEHSERAKQQAERERNELKAELDRERAARQSPSKPAEEAPEISRQWFENPDAVYARIEARAAEIAEAKVQEHWETKTREQKIADTYDKGGKAYDVARETLNVDPVKWNLQAPLVLLHLTNPDSPLYGDGQGIMSAERMTNAYKELFGDPTPAPALAVKPAAPEPPPPPGAKRAAATTSAPDNTSPLSDEDRRARQEIARITGLDANKLIKRGEKGARRG